MGRAKRNPSRPCADGEASWVSQVLYPSYACWGRCRGCGQLLQSPQCRKSDTHKRQLLIRAVVRNGCGEPTCGHGSASLRRCGPALSIPSERKSRSEPNPHPAAAFRRISMTAGRWARPKQGLNPARLCAMDQASPMARSPTSTIVVARHGVLVYERYYVYPNQRYLDATMRHVGNSMIKSVVSLLLGIAIDRGLIEDLDAPVFSYLPRICRSPHA